METSTAATGTITRTYETFGIRWDRGSFWSGYQSAEEAQRTVDFAATHGNVGTVERRTFTATFTADKASLYRPGISERVN